MGVTEGKVSKAKALDFVDIQKLQNKRKKAVWLWEGERDLGKRLGS